MEAGGSYCDSECDGYRKPPLVGDLWPGERREDFGYPAELVEVAEHVNALKAEVERLRELTKFIPSFANDEQHENQRGAVDYWVGWLYGRGDELNALPWYLDQLNDELETRMMDQAVRMSGETAERLRELVRSMRVERRKA